MDIFNNNVIAGMLLSGEAKNDLIKTEGSILLVGSGGREHSLCFKLNQSKKVNLILLKKIGSPIINKEFGINKLRIFLKNELSH